MSIRVKASLQSGKDTVSLTPTSASLRTLERALAQAGVQGTSLRTAKAVYVSLAELKKLNISVHADIELEMDRSIEEHLSSTSNGVENALKARTAIEELTKPGAAESMLSDFADRTVLDPHQIQAVAAAAHPDIGGLCIFDEQGLGKTVTALFAYHFLRGKGTVTRMLVIAPKNMVHEWVHDTERFFKGKYRAVAVVGVEKEKRATLNQTADIYVTNFETASSLEVRMRELLQAEHGSALLVVDESFFVKNTIARRTRSVKALRRWVQRCLVLCGTPAPNSPHDVVEQFNIADGGATFDGIGIPKDRDTARPVIQAAIGSRGIYLRRLKQDVMPQLPGKTFHRVLLPMQPEQQSMYVSALNGLISDLTSIDDVQFRKSITSYMARRMALLQLCSNPISVLNNYRELPCKLIALDSILEDLIGRRREKVVVWSFFTASLNAIVERYRSYNPLRFDGQVTDSETRRLSVRKFQDDDCSMLFVGNPAAAGAGLTLHRARFAVYESMSNQAAHYLQSLDRIHRRGQERAVEYLILLCNRTIEIVEYDRLTLKEAAAQQLLGDRLTPPITRTAMLDEAMHASRLLN